MAVQDSNKRRKMEGKKQLKHLPPGERMASILRHWEEFCNKNIVPAKEFAPELWTEICDKLKDKSSKASSAEQITCLERFKECMKSNEPRNLKATRPVGIVLEPFPMDTSEVPHCLDYRQTGQDESQSNVPSHCKPEHGVHHDLHQHAPRNLGRTIN